MAERPELVHPGKEKAKGGSFCNPQTADEQVMDTPGPDPCKRCKRKGQSKMETNHSKADPDQINRTKTLPSERFSTGTGWPGRW